VSACLKQELEDGGVDAGLLMLVATTSPERPWTHREIAYVCGCSRTNIWLIEQAAWRKIKRELRRRGFRDLTSLMSVGAGEV
jgi:hypothetical protein